MKRHFPEFDCPTKEELFHILGQFPFPLLFEEIYENCSIEPDSISLQAFLADLTKAGDLISFWYHDRHYWALPASLGLE